MHARAPVALLQAGPRHRHPRAGSRPSGWVHLIHNRVRCLRRARNTARRGQDVTATAPPAQFRIRGPAEQNEPGRRPGSSDDRILGQGVAGVS